MDSRPKVKISAVAIAKKREEISLSDKIEESKGKHLRTEDRFDQLKRMVVFDRVEEMILSGWTIREVADFIMQPENASDLERLEVRTKRSIEALLFDWRASMADTRLIERRLPKIVKESADKIEDTVDEIVEMNELYALQKQRISIDVASEQKIKKLFKTTGNEIQIAMNILQKMMEMKQDIGLLTKNLGVMNINGVMSHDYSKYDNGVRVAMLDTVAPIIVTGKQIGRAHV